MHDKVFGFILNVLENHGGFLAENRHDLVYLLKNTVDLEW